MTSWLQTFRIDGLPRRARVRTESRLPLTSVCVDATIILPPPLLPSPLPPHSPTGRVGAPAVKAVGKYCVTERTTDYQCSSSLHRNRNSRKILTETLWAVHAVK